MTRGRVLAALVVVALLALLLWRAQPEPVPSQVRVVAVGGMACDPLDPEFGSGAGTATACRQQATSDVAVDADPDLLAGLGDYQYEVPAAASYAAVYGPSWGRLRSRTRPALGNQEYKVNQANTFFEYFGDRAGPTEGWYSYQAGPWHVVVLNSNCTQVGGCDAASEQARWLEQDLAASSARCTLAYWHHPRFSTGLHGSDPRTEDLWAILQRHRAELVLAAHEHDYERFGRLGADGTPSPTGISSFVVGTGGQAHYATDETEGYADRRRAEVDGVVLIDDTFGVLVLDLDREGWSSRFVDDGGTVLDRSRGTCR